MKFSLNLADNYSNVDLKSLPHDEIVARMGAQLGSIEDIETWSEKYTGIVIARVVTCQKHPNADKLSVCLIDDGGVADVDRNDEGYVQVVCGAPNVREGLLVAWIPPGAVVPASFDTDRFMLEARKIRGEISNGMLASPSELAMSDDHDGILEINPEVIGRTPKLGESFSNFYQLDDFVVTCENKMFTHRPDCFGNLGIARELAGIFDLKFQSPDWYIQKPEWSTDTGDSALTIKNDISGLVPRFMCVVMDSIQVKPSEAWLQAFLKRVGIKPINNVVDITNYIMHLTGQPLHAFDHDKLQKYSDQPSLMPRMAKKGEKLTLLGEKEIELTEADMVIATDKKAVALAGIMGGAETEVDEHTKKIVIECANFDMYAVRRTSMRHGLFTEAVTRFNKGQSPLQNDRVLWYAMKLMQENASASQASPVYDLVDFDIEGDVLNHVNVSVDFINSRLGSELNAQDVKTLLENVEFTVVVQGADLLITAPFWRMDISIAEDVVEEVGRLYGYDKLPVVLPARSSKPNPINIERDFKQLMREKLARAGANEVLTYSFVHGKLLENTCIDPEQWAYHLRNALSPDLQYYRPSLLPSLLAKVRMNSKAQAGSDNNVFALFELGKVHVKGHFEETDESLPKQMNRLSFVLAGDDKYAQTIHGAAYYHAKEYVDLLTQNQAVYIPLDTNEYPLTAPYQKERSAIITLGPDETPIGVVGEFQQTVTKSLKLPYYCAGFELDIDLLRNLRAPNLYKPISSYPSSMQDMTFDVDSGILWGELYALVVAELAVASAEYGYQYTVEPLAIYQAEEAQNKRYSIRITLAHHQKTLKTSEVNALLDKIAKAVHEEYRATRV